MPALLSALLLLIAMIVYPVAYALFAVFYSLYGTILFVTGPLVLALMPSFGLGSLARRYAINVVIFASWGLIYGIFCRLAIAINVNSMAALTSANSFAGALAGASQEVLLAVASVLFSVCILLIPVLAKRIVEGDLGGSMLTVLGAATTMAQSLMSVAAGATGGMQAGGGGGGGGGAAAGSGGGVAAASSNTAPAGPSGGGAAHLAAPVRRVDHPAAEAAVADLETFALPIFRTPRVGLAALWLPWPCEVDKPR